MDEHVEFVLRELGFDPKDCAQSPQFHLLLPILSSIQKENILSPEEADALEYAEAAGLDRDTVLKKLAEHGIDEDILQIEESDIEYLEKKLQECESNTYCLDSSIDTLRQEEATLNKTIKEMQEKIQERDIENHVRRCEGKWEEINVAIQNVCQEIEELQSINNDVNHHQKVLEYLSSHEKELNKFMEHEEKVVDDMYSRILKNESAVENKHVHNTETEMERINGLEPRLTCLHFERIMKEGKNNYRAPVDKSGRNAHFPLTAVLEDFSHIHHVLSLSKKLDQLDVKVLALQSLDQRKAQMANWLVNSTNLLEILEKERAHLDLVFIVQSLYHEKRSSVQELINSCHENIHEEFTSISARVKNLEVASQHFKTSLVDTFPEELGRLCTKYFPGEKGNIEDVTFNCEMKLERCLEEQKLYLIASKRNLLEIEEIVVKLQTDINSSMEIFSQIEMACKTTSGMLEIFKETERRLKALLSTSPTRCMFWALFLTDIKTLKELRYVAEPSLENSPGSNFFVSAFPCFTSTPKKDD